MKRHTTLIIFILFTIACTRQLPTNFQTNSIPTQPKLIKTESIITMTKNDTQKLATLAITQSWQLDTLQDIYRPIKEKHKATLTYFQDEIAFKPHIFEIQIDTFLEPYYQQSIDLVFLYGMSYMDVKNEGTELPFTIDYNNFQLKKGHGKAFSTRHDFKFESHKNEKGIIELITKQLPKHIKKTKEKELFTIDVEQCVIKSKDL